MNLEKLAEVAVRDPLSETTRKERKSLLGIGIVGIAIVKGGLVPNGITALGIEFTEANQKSLFHILAAIVIYYLVAFVLYAISDLTTWRIAFATALKETMNAPLEIIADPPKPPNLSEAEQRANYYEDKLSKMENELRRKEILARTGLDFEHLWTPNFLIRISMPVSLLRAVFEFVLPLVIGGYALWLFLSFSSKL
jgi:hypothetical protein